MTVGFIGAGKVGTAFGRYLLNKGIHVNGYWNRGEDHLQRAINLTNTKAYQSKQALLKDSDIIFITVKDDIIKEISDEIATLDINLKNKSIVHMSGAHSSMLLESCRTNGAELFSLHPLQSVTNIEKAVKDFDQSIFSIESYTGEFNQEIKAILDVLGDRYFTIERDKKVIYHMAACVFSNYLTTLMDFGLALTDSIGLEKEKAFKAMRPLIDSTLKNIETNGIEQSLSGPLARGDQQTIKDHLSTYSDANEAYEDFYRFMGIKTLEFIKKNEYLESQEIRQLREVLKGGSYD
jgi:predicted short-subunit dehydrogenase-like oxidoreductase (DUF2520 family)